jgi:hypothetical protein
VVNAFFVFVCNIHEENPMRAFGTPRSHIADHAVEETAQQFSVFKKVESARRIPCSCKVSTGGLIWILQNFLLHDSISLNIQYLTCVEV